MSGLTQFGMSGLTQFVNQKSNSSDILRWDMGVMFAKSYVLQMSDNIKRSKEEALKKGIWVGLAPFGYLHTTNDKGNKTIIPDPNLKYLIGHMFEQYASGNASLLSLTEKMHAMGMRTKGGCLASPEIKKGKYIYYSCTNAKNNCSREYVREEVLLEALGG